MKKIQIYTPSGKTLAQKIRANQKYWNDCLKDNPESWVREQILASLKSLISRCYVDIKGDDSNVK